MTKTRWIINTIVLVLLCGCAGQRKGSELKSFYYWRTTYKLNTTEKLACKKLAIHAIYYRAFDIEPSKSFADLTPTQVMQWQQEPLQNVRYVPVVFIRNEVFLKGEDLLARNTSDANQKGINLDSAGIRNLAASIVRLCTQINAYKKLPCDEIQIDCDWSESTQHQYFYLLHEVNKLQVEATSTLRLWQHKDPVTAGVPPVSVATLMCYNMGDIRDAGKKNSIINMADIRAYLGNAKNYPCKIKIAMPIFSWYVHFSESKFVDIMYTIEQPSLWTTQDSITYICIQSHLAKSGGYQYKATDKLVLEHCSAQMLQAVENYINSKNLNTAHETIYFSLDSAALTRYGNQL
jgi:hypothetical protein